MSTPPTAQGPQCDTCAKRFKAGPALIQHSLDTGHGAHRYCTPCKRQFGTSQAFEDHRATSKAHQKKSRAHTTSAPKTVKTSSSLGQGDLSTPKVALVPRAGPSTTQQNAGTNTGSAEPEPAVVPLTITCRGNTYSWISKKRHYRTLEALKSLCHSANTLQRHGYKFNNNSNGLPSTITSDKTSGSATMVGETNDVDNITFSTLPRQNHNARRAVAIDCEMVGVEGGKSEIISLSAVDFLTGEEILNLLVWPHQPVVQWRTNLHGISPAILSMARAQGSLLDGWPAARAELFKHVDENTILVGHSLHHDLHPLRIQHNKIVDSVILASDTVFGCGDGKQRYWGLGLQTLCEELVGLRIREDSSRRNGANTHDGLEDALATRELVLWCIRNEAAFKAWADDKLEAFELAQEQRRQARQRKRQATNKSRPRRPQAPEADFIYHYEDNDMQEEVLRWEDVVPYDVWPKSPPDSD